MTVPYKAVDQYPESIDRDLISATSCRTQKNSFPFLARCPHKDTPSEMADWMTNLHRYIWFLSSFAILLVSVLTRRTLPLGQVQVLQFSTQFIIFRNEKKICFQPTQGMQYSGIGSKSNRCAAFFDSGNRCTFGYGDYPRLWFQKDTKKPSSPERRRYILLYSFTITSEKSFTSQPRRALMWNSRKAPAVPFFSFRHCCGEVPVTL